MAPLIQYWQTARRHLQSHWFHIPCQIVVAAFCAHWYWHIPAPSKAVLILTGVTVVIALLGMRTAHKAVYLILVICLMFIENRAVNNDRLVAQQAEEKRAKDEHEQFQKIADGLSATIANSNRQFSATSSGLSSIDINVQQLLRAYLKNTIPPSGFMAANGPLIPNPPAGLLVAPDGDFGLAARSMAQQIFQFLSSQGTAPTLNPGETDVSFIVRSNIWYSKVMDQYKKQFGSSVSTMVGFLIASGVLDERVGDLAKDPVNTAGIRTLAEQIQAGGTKLQAKNRENK